MIAPSSCASCMWAMACSALVMTSYVTYAVPRLKLTVNYLCQPSSLNCSTHFRLLACLLARLHCLFIGISTSLISPYDPKISLTCASVTFLVSFSTTIFALRWGGVGLRRERGGVCEVLRGAGDRLRGRKGVRERDRDARGVIERRGVRLRDGDLEDMLSVLIWMCVDVIVLGAFVCFSLETAHGPTAVVSRDGLLYVSDHQDHQDHH